ncbi:MAG TPA: FAD-dependent thymidylate synthase [Smithellaceae bacterium]|nr:FAD-dependent thymidylate synthase [Smithellaceae bacterium]
MKVILAGYNLDNEVINDLKDGTRLTAELTPETISAAYARISRSPKPVNELRREARREVDKARQSNRTIVFAMGHSSVAEHAVFNIDVLGVSRLLVEEIEKFRLCSYTEKSQRYVLFARDYVIPEEVSQAGLAELFTKTVTAQSDFYQELYNKLRPYVFADNKKLAADPANKSLLEGWAKEDARYAIALAYETQLGMTINARNLELMLRRLAALPLTEAREFAGQLYAATKDIAPSLIRYTEPTNYDRLTRLNLRKKSDELFGFYPRLTDKEDVRLIYATPDADIKVLSALLFSSTNLSYIQCSCLAALMRAKDKTAFLKIALENMQAHDAALRELENVDLQFELIMSASCFAQLKRHRMATILAQNYEPALGVTIPSAVRAVGMQKKFMSIMHQTIRAYEQIKKAAPGGASYILTNAHRRRVLMKINARELYHIARLRADGHAQWDIRELAEKMLIQARKAMPLTLTLACGKDSFSDAYKNKIGHPSRPA